MDTANEIKRAIGELSEKIEAFPEDVSLYMERGRQYHRSGDFGQALNDFIKASTLDPDNAEARSYIGLLREIFAFRNTDIYNP